MAEITVTCPGCSVSRVADDRVVGKTVACQTCGTEFVVRATTAAASPSPLDVPTQSPQPNSRRYSSLRRTLLWIGGMVAGGVVALSLLCVASVLLFRSGSSTTAKDYTSAEFETAIRLMQSERELTHGDLARCQRGTIPTAFWEAVFGRAESRMVRNSRQEIWSYITRDGQVTLHAAAFPEGYSSAHNIPYLEISVANSTGLDRTPPDENRLKRSLASIYAGVSHKLPPDSLAGVSWAEMAAQDALEQAARDAKRAEEERLAEIEAEKEREANQIQNEADEAQFDYTDVYRGLPYGDVADAFKGQESSWRGRRATFLTSERHAGRVGSDDYRSIPLPSSEELEAAFRAGMPFPIRAGEVLPPTPTDAAEMPPDESESFVPAPAEAPFDAESAREFQQSWAKHLGVEVEATLDCGIALVLVPPGSFVMGDDWPTGEGERQDGPPHRVKLSRPFRMSAHEVTVAQYRRFVDATGHPAGMPKTDFKQSDDHPIAGVTWTEAAAFCEWLSEEEGRMIRLPTEAEWEFACRAGTETPWNFGADDSKATDFCWYAANAGKRTHPIGSKQPNAFGLFDMHGNAREWCADWFVRDYAFPSSDLDPAGPAAGETKILRGGWYDETTWVARSSHRNGDFKPGWSFPGLGFRFIASAE